MLAYYVVLQGTVYCFLLVIQIESIRHTICTNFLTIQALETMISGLPTYHLGARDIPVSRVAVALVVTQRFFCMESVA